MATQNNGAVGVTEPKLTPAMRKKLAGPQLANSFTVDARLYRSFDESSTVFEYGELDLWSMREMLSKDGNPRKLEQVLTLPIRSADWEIRGHGLIPDFVRNNLDSVMDKVIAQCCSAIAYRKAFFELIWKLDGDQVVYDRIELRPATSCETAYDESTGALIGFRQRLAPINVTQAGGTGFVRIPAEKAFIYVHGVHREPLAGVSDLDVSLYCWDNIRKLQFLWCQYLEQQSLPKVIVYGDDPMQAVENAQMIADAAASASIPIERRIDPAQKTFELLESSGRGADQFEKAIQYFEGKQTQSVLASFMDLAQAASLSSAGSNALSADQSEFYLASRQAVANEIGEQITNGLIAPLVAYNFGPDAEVPDLHFAPIGNRQTDRALNLLMAIVAAQKPTVPTQFTGFLINQVSAALGLDTTDVSGVITDWAERHQEMVESAEAAATAAAEMPVPLAPPAKQQPVPGADALAAGSKTGTAQGSNKAPARVRKSPQRKVKSTQMSLAIDMAHELVENSRHGVHPRDTLNAMRDRD